MSDKKLSDSDIETLVNSKVAQASTWYHSNKLSRERERVLEYYNGSYPKRIHDGSSTYVSTEVYDTVEMMRAQLLETFSGGREIIKFDPQNPDDVRSAAIATKFTDYVVFRQNDGYQLFSDVIFDGLTSRVGVAKVYWEECEDYVDEEFEDLPEEAVMGMAAMDEIDSLEAEADKDDPGMYDGKVTRKVDKSQVRIEVLNPEDFIIEPQAKMLSSDYFCAHSSVKTYDDLIKQGYPEDKLKKAKFSADPSELRNRTEVLARFQQLDEGARFDDDQQSTEWLTVHECYIKLRRGPGKYSRLHKVVLVGKVLVDIEEVDDLPFVVWTPLPISHSFYGNNFASRVIPYQNIRTNLIRSIVDHVAVTNNPRYAVVRGGLTNPRELLDNRLGGLVNVTRPDAILPIPQAPMNPYVYQTLEMLKMQKEEMTGISSLSQGLNKDAVSNQNSQGLINDLVNLSQTRQKVIARNFAYQFLIPLYLKVYNLVLRNEDREVIVDVAGDWVYTNPQSWVERKSCTVSVHLGYGELEREALKYGQMASVWAQDPQLQNLFTVENRYKMAMDVAKMMGISNVNDYLTPPDQIEPPQPDPVVMAEIQNETIKAQAAMVTAEAAKMKVETYVEVEQMRATLNKMQADFDNVMAIRDADRKDLDIANKVDIGQREMTLAEEIEPMEVKQNNLISPRG